MIRTARNDDLNRIAEIEVFNYRLKFYPIFLDDAFYFGELQVPNVARRYADSLEDIRVWDDGVVKGFILVRNGEVKKLFVEPVLQGQGIGARLLEYAVEHYGCKDPVGLGTKRRSHPLLSAARLPADRRKAAGGWNE